MGFGDTGGKTCLLVKTPGHCIEMGICGIFWEDMVRLVTCRWFLRNWKRVRGMECRSLKIGDAQEKLNFVLD
jgi:hypothetical protein